MNKNSIVIEIEDKIKEVVKKKYYFDFDVFLMYMIRGELKLRGINVKIEKSENKILIKEVV